MAIFPSVVTALFLGQLHPNTLTPCTHKLILNNGFNFHDSSIYNKLFSLILTTTFHPKVITVEDKLTDIPLKYQTQRHLINHNGLEIPKLEVLKHSCHYEAAINFVERVQKIKAKVTDALDINSNYQRFQVRGFIRFPFNVNPQNVHYIFVGNLETLREIFRIPSIRVLRHKTGIIINKNGTVLAQQLMETPIPFTRRTELVLKKFDATEESFSDVLKGRQLVVDSYPTKLHVVKDEDGNAVGGIPYKFVESISSQYNFTFDYKLAGYILKQLPNGTWTGFLDDMMKDRADMTMFPAPSWRRLPFCDLTSPIWHVNFGLITPVPRTGINWQAIFQTFEVTVWISIVFVCCVVSFLLTIKSNEVNIIESMWPTFFVLLRVPPKPFNNRKLLYISYLVFAMLIGMFFDSDLVSTLTLPQYDPVPSTIQELSKATKFRIDFTHYIGGIGTVFLEESKDPQVVSVRSRMNYVPIKQAGDKISKVALIGNNVVIDYQEFSMAIVAENLTLFPGVYPVKLGQALAGFHVGVGLRKYSKYTNAVSLLVARLGATGHYLKWHQDVLEILRRQGTLRRKRDDDAQIAPFRKALTDFTLDLLDVPFQAFTIHHFAFAFVALTVGYLAGGLLILMEVLRRKEEWGLDMLRGFFPHQQLAKRQPLRQRLSMKSAAAVALVVGSWRVQRYRVQPSIMLKEFLGQKCFTEREY